MLREYKNSINHFYRDDRGRYQGELKEWWWDTGVLHEHCYYKDSERHGECKWWDENGRLRSHCYYKDDKDITNKVKELVDDISNITKEERMMIKLKYGIECLS